MQINSQKNSTLHPRSSVLFPSPSLHLDQPTLCFQGGLISGERFASTSSVAVSVLIFLPQADEDTAEARKLADQYQPIIIEAERDKRDSDFHFQEFAHATHEVRAVGPPSPAGKGS